VSYSYPIVPYCPTPTNFNASTLNNLLQCYTSGSFFQLKELQGLPLHNSIKKRLERIEKTITPFTDSTFVALLSNLFFLQSEIAKLSKEVYVTFAHGSFLPNDFFVQNNHIYIYNWEYFNKSTIFLYDFFNIPMQLEAASTHPDYETAQKKVEELFAQPEMIETIIKYSLSIRLYYKIYILQAASAFLEYANNNVCAEQQQMQFWLDAINSVLKITDSKKQPKEKALNLS
jgi:hypothetical protein